MSDLASLPPDKCCGGDEMASHAGFNFHFLLQMKLNIFISSFVEFLVMILAHFSIVIIIDLLEVVLYSRYQSFVNYTRCKYLLPVCDLTILLFS